MTRLPSPTSRSTPRRGRAAARRVAPLIGVLAVIGLYVVMDVLRRADDVEIAGVALFAVVALGAARGWRAGLAAGAVATLVYAWLRREAVDLAGSEAVTRMIAARGLGYFAFGGIGGWLTAAVRSMVAAASTRREPASARGRAPSLASSAAAAALAREIARAERRNEPLSVVTIDLRGTDPAPVVANVGAAIRESDFATITAVGDEPAVTIVLPDTDRAGARVVVDRLQRSLGDRNGELASTITTLQEQPEEVAAARARLEAASPAPDWRS